MSETAAEPIVETGTPHSVRLPKPEREVALDALRGLAILAMYLSGIVPWNGLPAWMYHGQEPPPSHAFNPKHPGLTWVDLVFPFFLFAMGAAIPLALTKAIDRGVPSWRLALNALVRGALLVAFAIYVQHVRPYDLTDNPTTRTWLIGLLAFALSLPMFARLPESWPIWSRVVIRLIGWGAAAGLLSLLKYPDGTGFSRDRSDIIILVLSNMAFVAALVWLCTRGSDVTRIAVMAAVVALRLTFFLPGTPAYFLWHLETLSWAFQFSFLPYLLVLIPGTIVGELLLRPSKEASSWTTTRHVCIALMCFAIVPTMLALFFCRLAPLWVTPLVIAVVWIVRSAQTDSDRRIRSLVAWGVACLLIGCLLEPYQGGIKKDPPTFSYLLATPGLATLMLVAFMSIEKLRPRLLAMRFLGTTGQNPMLAYLAITNLIAPLWALTVGGYFDTWLPGPYLGMIRALVQVLLLGLIVAGFTKAKIYLRA